MNQIYVRWNGKAELTYFLKTLQHCGFKNVQHLKEDYAFPVLVVDLKAKVFFGTNSTCMAAFASSLLLQKES